MGTVVIIIIIIIIIIIFFFFFFSLETLQGPEALEDQLK